MPGLDGQDGDDAMMVPGPPGTGTVASSSDASVTIAGADTIINANWLNGFGLINGYLSTSVAANALTIAIKNIAGTDPSAANPVKVVFRNVTAGTGDYTVITLTAAASLVISSGSTMGFATALAGRLWVVGFNDGGTFRLGAVNCLNTISSSIFVMPLQDGIASSTAEGGAGAADSAHIIYTGTAVTSKAMRVLGYLEWSDGLTTPGTWDAVPTLVQAMGWGVHLPGSVVQHAQEFDGEVQTGTTVQVFDDTIPQNTEGNEFITTPITPSSKANLLVINGQFHLAISAGAGIMASLFQDSVADALSASWTRTDAVNGSVGPVQIRHAMRASTVGSTTFKVRGGGGAAGTCTFNGFSAARKLGGVMCSMLQITEIMA